jgi:hypothetical protein
MKKLAAESSEKVLVLGEYIVRRYKGSTQIMFLHDV